MTFELPIFERRLTNAARLIRLSMWLLFLAAGLTIIVRRSVPARTGSLWFLGGAVLALVLSFALRDVVRRVGHRNTEDSIVRAVKTYIERQPFLHRLDAGSHGLAAPLVEKSAGPGGRVVLPELLEGLLEKVSPDGFQVIPEQVAEAEAPTAGRAGRQNPGNDGSGLES